MKFKEKPHENSSKTNCKTSVNYYPGEKFGGTVAPANIPKYSSLKLDAPYLGDSIIMSHAAPSGSGLFNPGAFCCLMLAEDPNYAGIFYLAHRTSANAWFPDGSVAGKTQQGWRGVKRPTGQGTEPTNYVEPLPYLNY